MSSEPGQCAQAGLADPAQAQQRDEPQPSCKKKDLALYGERSGFDVSKAVRVPSNKDNTDCQFTFIGSERKVWASFITVPSEGPMDGLVVTGHKSRLERKSHTLASIWDTEGVTFTHL